MRLFILFAIILLLGCSNNDINDKSKRNSKWAWVSPINGVNGKWIKIGKNKEIPDCRYILFFDNGKIRERGKYLENKLSDTTYFYNLEERLIKLSFHSNNEMPSYYPNEGNYVSFYPTGEVKLTGEVKNGLLVGEWKIQSKFGTIISEGNRNFDSVNKTGWVINYYSNGQKKDSTSMENGKPHGEARFWYSDGTLSEIVNWEKGLQNGIYKTFYPNGNLKEKTMWLKGKKEGENLTFFPNGNTRTISNCIDGFREGGYKDFFPNGNLRVVESKSRGSSHGEFVSYYPDGKIFSRGQYIYGNLEGKWKFYSPSGNLFIIHSYKNNELIDYKELIQLNPKEKEQFLEVSEYGNKVMNN